MTFAWYGHLKHANSPLWKAIIVSWAIAFFEYCFRYQPTVWVTRRALTASS
ncbi:DMT family protein [Chitinophaga sedimenti]|nr:DMT family protein [Chitinophaga sedimenti]